MNDRIIMMIGLAILLLAMASGWGWSTTIWRDDVTCEHVVYCVEAREIVRIGGE